MVSIMTFSKLRIAVGGNNDKDDIFELTRFCNLCDVIVIGGASKLIKYFIR